MLAETKTMISAYQSDNMLRQFALDRNNSQGNVRRMLAAMKCKILAAEMHEEIYQHRILPEASLHKVYPAHCNQQKNKGKQLDLSKNPPVIEKVSDKTTKHIYEPGKVFPAIKG